MLIVLTPGPEPASRTPLAVGIVNNMPPCAVRATERQFCGLLAGASKRFVIGVQFFSITCSEAGEPENGDPGAYGGWRQLERAALDGLVVTGAPTPGGDLRDAPEWPRFAALIDMAWERKVPTIWSCLAAHAAARHLDNIPRRALPQQAVRCRRVQSDRGARSAHDGLAQQLARATLALQQIARGGAGCARIRYPAELARSGSRHLRERLRGPVPVLPRPSRVRGCTLLREYRRDIGEFLAGARRNYPDMPLNYFSLPAIAALDGSTSG